MYAKTHIDLNEQVSVISPLLEEMNLNSSFKKADIFATTEARKQLTAAPRNMHELVRQKKLVCELCLCSKVSVNPLRKCYREVVNRGQKRRTVFKRSCPPFRQTVFVAAPAC